MNLGEKLAPKSLLTRRDQLNLYVQEKGVTRANWNMYLTLRANGELCTCDPQWVTDLWRGPDHGPSHRLVHEYGCARRRRWMQTEKLFT